MQLSEPGVLPDATDLKGLRAFLTSADPAQRLVPLEMSRLVISGDAHLMVSETVSEILAGKSGPSVLVLTDTTAILRDGMSLSALVMEQLNQHRPRHVALDDKHQTLHADETVLDQAVAAAKGADAVVTIGSGTMTDIGKIAARRNGSIPHIVVQTAASVDGFTDNVSVILQNGVKRTVPSCWPITVLADTKTIGSAPRALNSAGFGEALSLFTAPADWYLANLVGLDTTFHPASMELLKAAAASPPDWAAGLAGGEHRAVEGLTRLLALRGIICGITNTTACLSGVEHVVSHMLDLHHAASHQPIGLHGAQVGVATLVATKLWRRAIETDMLKPELLDKPNVWAMELRVRAAFAHFGSEIADECWRDCARKLELIEENWQRLMSVAQNWKLHSAEFSKLVQPAERLRPALQASGAPASFAALSPSVSPELARWALKHCHLMRNRFNLVDLLDLMGLWTDEMIDWALA